MSQEKNTIMEKEIQISKFKFDEILQEEFFMKQNTQNNQLLAEE